MSVLENHGDVDTVDDVSVRPNDTADTGPFFYVIGPGLRGEARVNGGGIAQRVHTPLTAVIEYVEVLLLFELGAAAVCQVIFV